MVTFSRYTRFGIKLALFFGFTKFSQIQNHFPLSQIPKSLVACVMVCSDTIVEHESLDVSIVGSNFCKFFRLPIFRSNYFPFFKFRLPLNFKKKNSKKNSAFDCPKSGSRFVFPQQFSGEFCFRFPLARFLFRFAFSELKFLI